MYVYACDSVVMARSYVVYGESCAKGATAIVETRAVVLASFVRAFVSECDG
jgi:hypothetical protein